MCMRYEAHLAGMDSTLKDRGFPTKKGLYTIGSVKSRTNMSIGPPSFAFAY